MHLGFGAHIGESMNPHVYFNHMGVMQLWSKKHNISMFGTARIKVAAARNRIMKDAIELGCDGIMFVDSDHILPDDMLDLLLENKDAAMISGLICKRAYPYRTIGFNFINDRLEEMFIKADSGVHEVDACAMGCTYFNLEKIKGFKYPFFIDGPKYRSDINMCFRIKEELNEKPKIDSRVKIGHLGDPTIITPDNAQELREVYINGIE